MSSTLKVIYSLPVLLLWLCVSANPLAAFELPFVDGEQTLRLQMDEFPSRTLVQQKAKLLPNDLSVKVGCRLLVEAPQALERAQLPAAVQAELHHLELLQLYTGRYLYVLHYGSVAAALSAMKPLESSSLVSSVQPDLLPQRKPAPRLNREPYPLVAWGDNFHIADYVPLANIWRHTKGAGVKVAIIDTGVNLSHPALKQVQLVYSWDADTNAPLATGSQDDFHGTNVAGVIWSQPWGLSEEQLKQPRSIPNNIALGLAPEAELINLRLRYPWTSNVLRAFALSEQQGAQVINISWLLPWVSSPLRHYLRYLTVDAHQGKGIVVVVAANPQPVPNVGLAAMPELLVVTSTDHINQLAHASWDTSVDLAVMSYVPSVAFRAPRLYGSFAKTSASAPVMTGLLALFRALRPGLTASQLQLLLVSNGTPASALQLDGRALEYRYLDVLKAHQQLLER